MEFFSDMCILCLIHSNTVKSLQSKDENNLMIEEKLQYVVSEQTNFTLEVPKNICTTCEIQLNNLYKFKQNYVKNLAYLRKYVEDISTGNAIKTEPPNINDTEEQLPFQEVNIKEEIVDFNEESGAKSDPLSSGDIPENVTKDNQKCNECGVALTTNKKLKCDECSKKIQQPKAKIKPFKCEECGKTFSTNFNLKIHKRYHSGEKPFKCDECSKGFVSKEGLKIHKRTHSDNRPYKCTFCAYTCVQSEKLRSHLRTHTGERPFPCKWCNYKCALKSSLQSHERRKHPNLSKNIVLKTD